MKLKFGFFIMTLACTHMLLSQSKFANKGFKAYKDKNWEKLRDFLDKEKEKDSTSVGVSFLNLLTHKTDGMSPNAKLYFIYCNEFFGKLEKLDVKEQDGYCEELEYCLSNKSKIFSDNLKNYGDWIVQRKDTLEANNFLKDYSNSQSSILIRNFQYEFYKELLNKNLTREETKKYLLRFPQSPFYYRIAKVNDSLQFLYVIQQNNINSFEGYLADYPDGANRDSAVRSIEKLSWLKISASTQKNDFIIFQNKFPNSYYLNLAKDKEMELNWNEAKVSNSIELIQEFRQKYKGSIFENDAIKIEGNLVFNEAKNSKSVEKIRDFIENYKNSNLVNEAYMLEQQWVYELLKSSPNIELYEKYILDYPSSLYNKSVDSLIYNYYIQIAQNIFNIDTLKLLSQKTTNLRFNKFVEKRVTRINQIDIEIETANDFIKSNKKIIPQNVLINLSKGKISIKTPKSMVELFDVQNDPHEMANYYYKYLTYFPSLKSHLINLIEWSGPKYLLFDDNTGKSTEINGKIVSFFRIDTSVNFIVKLDCEPLVCEGFQIFKKNKKDFKLIYRHVLDSNDFSVKMDSVYFQNGKIYCIKSYEYSDFNYKKILGLLEFQKLNQNWVNTAFYSGKIDTGLTKQLSSTMINQMIESRQPLFNSGKSMNPIVKKEHNFQKNIDEKHYFHRYIYKLDDFGELKPVEYQANYAIYPLKFISPEILKNMNVNGKNKFDLICTKRPYPGLDFANINKYTDDYQRRNDLIYINFDSALLNGEIQTLPQDFNPNQLNLLSIYYNVFKSQNPGSLSPFQLCSFIAKKYTFIDEFKKKKLIEKWTEYFVSNLVQKKDYYESVLNGTFGFSCVAHLEEYNMQSEMFEVEYSGEEYYSYSRNRENFEEMLDELGSKEVSIPENFLNSSGDYSINIKHPRKSDRYSSSNIKIYVKEDKASQLTNILNSDRNLYMRVKTKMSPYNYNEYCDLCSSGNCDNESLSKCKLNFDVIEYEFSASPDFKDAIKVKP